MPNGDTDPKPLAPSSSSHLAPSPQPPISFCSISAYPYCLLSNFYGDVELHFMAERFQHPALKTLILDKFATCNAAQFRAYFRALYPSGKPDTYVRATPAGDTVIARGILGKLAGTAAVSSSAPARRRLAVLRRLARLPADEPVKTNTDAVLLEAGVSPGAERGERERAILAHNTRLMRQCLRRKYSSGRRSDDGLEFQQLLVGTQKRRLRERAFGRGSRWSGRGEDDGLMAELLVELRTQLQSQKQASI